MAIISTWAVSWGGGGGVLTTAKKVCVILEYSMHRVYSMIDQ